MEDVTLAHAKEHLEELIERAARGEDVRIVDPKVGRVRLMAVDSASVAPRRATDSMPPFVPLAQPRVPGRLEGKVPPPPPGFFDPLTNDQLKEWYGDEA